MRRLNRNVIARASVPVYWSMVPGTGPEGPTRSVNARLTRVTWQQHSTALPDTRTATEHWRCAVARQEAELAHTHWASCENYDPISQGTRPRFTAAPSDTDRAPRVR